MALTKNSYFVYGGIIAAAAYLIFEMWPKSDGSGWSKMIPLFTLGISAFFFNKHFIDIAKVEKVSPIEVGPEMPFIPSAQEWDFDRDGKPIKKFRPPKAV